MIHVSQALKEALTVISMRVVKKPRRPVRKKRRAAP
jgi:hypothetical protein